MILDIINAISTLIAQQSDATINLSNQGEGFKRPSFFISQINANAKDLNKFVMDNNIFIQIVYYAPYVDDYNNVDAVNQYKMYDSLKEIFKVGYFMVGDRAVKLAQNGMTGGPRNAEVYLTLNLTLTEDKQPANTNTSTIQSVKLNLKGVSK